jgi:hypothetical protein
MSEVSSATGRRTEHRKGVAVPATAEAKPSGLSGHAFSAQTPMVYYHPSNE